MINYSNYSKEDFEDSQIYLGEDWYLIYEEREDNTIYISDLSRVEPALEDEGSIQQQEMMKVIFGLLRKYDRIEADLKEDTSYLLYLMSKKLGYVEQIGEDARYSYINDTDQKIVTSQEQEELLRNQKSIRLSGNKELWMHKVTFQKGKLLASTKEKGKIKTLSTL